MDCSLPGSFVHGISQAKILEWVAISFSRGSSWPRDQTCVFCIAGGFFITELPGKPFENYFVIKNWNFGKNYILHPHWFTHVTHILLLIISSVEQYITREWMIHTCNSNKQLRCIPCLSLCFTLNDVRQFSYDDYAFWVYSEKPCRRHILYHRWVPLAWAGWRLAQNNRLCFLNL